MWLILCDTNDLAALWAYQQLRSGGLAPLELVTAGVLVNALRWEHRVGASEVSTTVRLADGRSFASGEVQGVLNRLRQLPDGPLQLADPADREYACTELYAFFASWLYALPGVVLNRPRLPGLGERWRPPCEWTWLAAQAGLSTAPHTERAAASADRPPPPRASLVTVFVVAGRLVGSAVPPEAAAACRRLAALVRTEILAVRLAPAHGWSFADAETFPDLRLGGEPLIASLASALQGETSWD